MQASTYIIRIRVNGTQTPWWSGGQNRANVKYGVLRTASPLSYVERKCITSSAWSIESSTFFMRILIICICCAGSS